MATWQRFVTDEGTNGVDPNATLTLDGALGGSAPGDFNPANITSIDLFLSLTGSGWDDDSWGASAYECRYSGGQIAIGAISTSGNQNTTVTDGPDTDGTPATGNTPDTIRTTLTYDKTKGADGGSVQCDNASYIIITYTPAGITGSGAITEGSDDASGIGAVLVAGTGAISEVSDNTAGSGDVLISGSGAITEQPDDVIGLGTVLVSGGGAIAELTDEATGVGNVLVAGAGAITEQPDSASGAGAVLVSGSAAITEQPDDVAGTGNVLVSGAGAITELADDATGSGTVGEDITGLGAIIESSDSATGAGTILISGSGAIAEVSDVMSNVVITARAQRRITPGPRYAVTRSSTK